jgi:V/A-type H+-transporting ATPase subunit K
MVDPLMAAAIAIGLTGIATGIAQGMIGSAAAGAVAEKEDLFMKMLLYIAIPETIIVLGFAIAFIILGKAH